MLKILCILLAPFLSKRKILSTRNDLSNVVAPLMLIVLFTEIAILITEHATTNISNLFHASLKYGESPYPVILISASHMKTPVNT